MNYLIGIWLASMIFLVVPIILGYYSKGGKVYWDDTSFKGKLAICIIPFTPLINTLSLGYLVYYMAKDRYFPDERPKGSDSF